MSADQTLETLRKSLEPKQQPKQSQKQKPVTLADALLKIPELTNLMKQVISIRQREVDTLKVVERFDFDIQKLVVQSDQNLTEINRVEKRLDKKIRHLEVLEAKWQLIIDRIDGVLNELERVLKNS